jgi:hypothetical protein
VTLRTCSLLGMLPARVSCSVEASRWHCHGVSGLRSLWRPDSQGNEEHQLRRLPVPAEIIQQAIWLYLRHCHIGQVKAIFEPIWPGERNPNALIFLHAGGEPPVLLTRKASERDNAASCARPPENPGLLRLKDFVAEGIGPETLARLVREEAVVRLARGLYQLPDAQVEASHTLAEAAVLVPKGGSLPDLSPPIPRTDTADAVGCMDGDRPLRLAAQDRLSPYLVCALHWIGTDRRGRASSHRERRRLHHGSGEDDCRLLSLSDQDRPRRRDGGAARGAPLPPMQAGSALALRPQGAGLVSHASLRRSYGV